MTGGLFEDGFWTSSDELTLHYRDYAGRADRPPLLCIPGLTRNARDFEAMAREFAGEWRIICVDLRGRGASDYARDSESYTPVQYLEDLALLLDKLDLRRFVAVGTSLGGILTMLLAQTHKDRLAGALINDIGPKIERAGLERIEDYVGQGRTYPTWMHAARALMEQQGSAFPGYDLSRWLGMAKRLMTLGGNGRIMYDYDMRIADTFGDPAVASATEIWDLWKGLAGRPVTVLRGEVSDILSPATFARMKTELPEAELVTIPGVGHAPALDEPESLSALASLLGRVA